MLSLCLSVSPFSVFLSHVFPLNTEEEKDLEHCILFVPHPLFASCFWLFILGRVGFDFEDVLNAVREVVNI